MAGTAEILKDIELVRNQISLDIDLLSEQKNDEIAKLVKKRPLESILMVMFTGFLAALLFKKAVKLIRLALFLYTIKQTLSFLFKQK